MVQMYTVAGQKIGSHYLAMGVLATIFGGAFYGVSGGKPKTATATPPINASSSDEGDFIKKFLEQADKDEKAKH